MESRCSAAHATFPLTEQERGACHAALQVSQHTALALLPNHHMNENLELAGYHFTCPDSEPASVLPVPSNMFNCIVMYEVISDVADGFNQDVLRVLCARDKHQQQLDAIVAELRANTTAVPGFACISEDAADAHDNPDELCFSAYNTSDQREWAEQLPRKIGLYHAFVRPHTKDSIDHKLFIVVAGSLAYADEEFHRLWQDAATISCRQLLDAEETHWLRAATLRNHNRVAARLADSLGLHVRCVLDTDDPSGTKRAAIPTTVSLVNDLYASPDDGRVHLADGACFLHKAVNGVLFEMHATEGFWLFCGPPDHADSNAYGTIFNYHGSCACFPTTTVRYHQKFAPRGVVVCTQRQRALAATDEEPPLVSTLFPDEAFMRVCEQLGFNRNHGLVSLMPLVAYASPSSV
jgi:hypothetical protein